jgi:hypothetical protein
MDIHDRFHNDPAFKGLVDMLTSFLLDQPHLTPTELREAAMYAAQRVDAMTLKDMVFDRTGNLLASRSRSR